MTGRLVYPLVRSVFRCIAWPMFRFRVRGVERIPREGPGIVVAPHRSWLDPACVGGACPRQVHFLILDTVYRRRWSRWFYRAMGALPVRGGDGGQSLGSLREALRLLKRGELVGVFPEGRVFKESRPGPLQLGAAMLAVRTQAPVIPMFIEGSAAAWPHGRSWPGPGRVSVSVGSPIWPAGGRDRAAAERLREQIGEAMGQLSRASAAG